MPDPVDDNTEDFTVYDLADRMSGGIQISEPGQRKVAGELLRLRGILKEQDHAFDGDGCDCRICGEGRAHYLHCQLATYRP
jgi:hypothetical protein